MKDTKFRILLDIHEVRSQATIPVKVGDVSCKIYITLVEGGKPYKIHENSFGVFTGKKGDDNYIFNNCIVENGIIRYDFTPQTVAAAGVLECEVRIYDEDGGVLTTPSFNIVVDERAVNDSELASASEFAFLDEILVNEGQRIQNERNRNEAFNNLGIDLEDDGEVISIVKTDIDGSQEKASFLKYADVIPPVTATATGSAITIESSQAPLQNLKLYGKTTQNGTPTPDAPVPLVSVGDSGSFAVGVYKKNLIPYPYYDTTKTENGITFTVNSDGTITVNGTATDTAFFRLVLNLYLPEGHYYISDGVNRADAYCRFNVTLLNQNFWWGGGSTDVEMRVSAGATLNNVVFKPQIEIGTQATPYEKGNKQTLTITDTLRGIGDIADVKDFARGVKTERIKEVLAKDYTLYPADSTDNYFIAYIGGTGFPAKEIGISSHLPYLTSALGQQTGFIVGMYASPIHISIPKTIASDVTTLRQWLIDNNVKFYYPIAEPIETPISETELNAYRQLYTNKGNTTILNSDGADMEISYYINKPNAQAIGNIHSQVNKDYLKLQQAIISTGGSTL
jgi:hypothetical protein